MTISVMIEGPWRQETIWKSTQENRERWLEWRSFTSLEHVGRAWLLQSWQRITVKGEAFVSGAFDVPHPAVTVHRVTPAQVVRGAREGDVCDDQRRRLVLALGAGWVPGGGRLPVVGARTMTIHQPSAERGRLLSIVLSLN